MGLDGDNLLIPTASRSLMAVNKRSLQVQWVARGPTWYVLNARPVVDDGRVYLCASTELVCLDAASGQEVWRSATAERCVHPPAVLDDRIIVPLGRHQRVVLCLDRNGMPMWRVPLEDGGWEYSVIDGFDDGCVVRDDTVFVGSPDGFLYALSATDGSVRWRVETLGAVLGRPHLTGDVVLFGSTDGHLYAANATDGTLLSKTEIGGEIQRRAHARQHDFSHRSETVFLGGRRRAPGGVASR
jgi:outer membrane protein assembly factor BamB